jgi:hypothetical protein
MPHEDQNTASVQNTSAHDWLCAVQNNCGAQTTINKTQTPT